MLGLQKNKNTGVVYYTKGDIMPYLYLVIVVFMNASSSVFGKFFNKKNQLKIDSTVFYNFLLLLSVFICWGVIYVYDFSFDINVLGYSLLFAFCYTVCKIGIISSLKYGPSTLTSLFTGLSLLATTIWGFIFWETKLTTLVVIGLFLVVCAITLCLYTRQKDKKSFSWKWLIYVLLAFFGNAGCTIVQRTQQMHFNGQHGNMLMFFATGFSALTYLFIYLRSERKDSLVMLKTSWWVPICAGICNVILNVFVIILALTNLSPSLIYPVIGIGGLAIVTIFSIFIFKEKMHWWQWLGVGIGAIATVLLSL